MFLLFLFILSFFLPFFILYFLLFFFHAHARKCLRKQNDGKCTCMPNMYNIYVCMYMYLYIFAAYCHKEKQKQHKQQQLFIAKNSDML